jgi:phosphoribosylanthranilate isomerase
MTWIKICGITSVEALDAAVGAGADAVGFVLDPESPRNIDADLAAALCERAEVLTYVVTVDRRAAEVVTLATSIGVDGVQSHGRYVSEAVPLALQEGLRVLRPVRVTQSGPETEMDDVPAGAVPLFDTGVLHRHGGTGSTFDWGLLPDTKRDFVLAGGLGPDNVGAAIAVMHPYGVDASSRLESAPGVKDPDMIRAFIERVRST